MTEADRAANVIGDEIVDLVWKAKHRTRPDHPVRLICVAVKPHAGCRSMRGPTCDGVLRLVTNRLDLPAEPIAEMYRLRWVIEMFFRTFKQLLGCRHLFSGDQNGVEIQAYCAMIVCMLILIDAGEKPNRAMYQMVWYYLIGLASLKELEVFINTRRQPASAQPRPHRHVGFAAAQSECELSEGLPVPRSRAMGASAARMAKRSGHAESGGHDGHRERPAMGHWRPRATQDTD